jgi:6,7-dimethyl-8-ribityllumazine synthase
MNKILIIEASYYPEVIEILTSTAIKSLSEQGIDYERIKVSRAYDIPATISIALDSFEYDGVIALGCIISSHDITSQVLFQECARGLNDLAMHFSLPIGFGVMLMESKELAIEKATQYALQATESCLELVKIKSLYQSYNNDNGRGYKN